MLIYHFIIGGILKASLAQYVSLEITKGNGRDTRSANKFLPWLFNPPSNTASQVFNHVILNTHEIVKY